MNDLELMRLYLLYKAGSVQDGRQNSDLLQIAKATANDLTEEEFVWLHKEVEHLRSVKDSQAKEKRSTVGTERVGEKQWNIWQSAKSFAMGSSDYQKRLWELPDLVRSDKPFTPTRLADGNPIDLDPNDPEGSQERLKSQPYSQVKHDPKLRDAWHAAQSGKLADMLKGGDVWQAYTDPQLLQEGVEAAKPVRSSLSAPLRSLLRSMDAGELDWRHNTSANAFSRDLPTHGIYKQDTNELVSNLMGPDSLSFQRPITEAKANLTPTSMPFSDVMAGKKEEDIRKWVHEVREHHEKKVRQNLVDYQIAGYRPTVAKQAGEAPASIPSNSTDSLPVQIPKSGSGGDSVEAPPIQTANNVQAPPVQIDLGKAARQNAANDATAQGIVEDPLNLPGSGKGSGNLLDKLQTGMDAVGVADPTPIVDGINAGISVVRAFTDPKNAGTHLVNAGVSAISMVPYLGDVAKVFKYGGKAAKAGSEAAKAGKVAGEVEALQSPLPTVAGLQA